MTVGIVENAGRGGVLAIMRATHVVAELVGEGVVADGIGAADDVERVAGEVGRRRGHQVTETRVGGLHGFRKETDNVGAELIAGGVDGVHVTVAGILQTGQVRGGIAGFGVGHFSAVDEIQGDGNQAVRVGLVGLGDGQIDQGVHRGQAAGAVLRGRRVDDHDVDIGVRAGVWFRELCPEDVP